MADHSALRPAMLCALLSQSTRLAAGTSDLKDSSARGTWKRSARRPARALVTLMMTGTGHSVPSGSWINSRDGLATVHGGTRRPHVPTWRGSSCHGAESSRLQNSV